MKKLFAILAVIVAILFYLNWLERQPHPVQTAAATPRATATPLPTLPPNYVPDEPEPPSGDYDERVDAVARSFRMEIVNYADQGGSAVLDVEWASDIATEWVDFAEELRRRGIIRRFQTEGVPINASRGQDGRRFYHVRFRVFF